MGMKRNFQAECDSCGRLHYLVSSYSSDVRECLKTEGWRVNNDLVCPDCLMKAEVAKLLTKWDEVQARLALAGKVQEG